jgi:hypothetical protein
LENENLLEQFQAENNGADIKIFKGASSLLMIKSSKNSREMTDNIVK